MEGRDAVGETFLRGQLDLLAQARPGLLGRRVPGLVADEALGRLEEGADGLPRGVADDLAAFGVGRRRRDLRQLHGLGVGERRMAAGVGQEDRVVRARFTEGGVKGQAVDVGLGHAVPLVLVPAPAEDPVAGLGRGCGLGDQGDDLVPGAGLGQVEDHLGGAEAGEVAVALDEAGDGQGAAEVDDLGAVADVAGIALRLGAEGGDAVAADGDP